MTARRGPGLAPRADKKVEMRARALTLRLEGRSYAKIGHELGVSGQRIQQIVQPSFETRRAIRSRAGDACEQCEADGVKLDIHHLTAVPGMTPESFNAESNLLLLCVGCHTKRHADPAIAERNRAHQSPEARAARATTHSYSIGAFRLGISVDEYRQHRENDERWCWAHQRWDPADQFQTSRSCIEGMREYVRQQQTPEYVRDYYQRNRERLNTYRSAWARQKRQKAAAS